MSVNAYLADVTSPETRTKRVALMSGLWPIGYNIGKALSGVVKTELGFLANFSLGMALSLCAMLYIMFFVRDSIKIREARLARERSARGQVEVKAEPLRKYTRGEKFKALFDLTNLKAGFRALFAKRNGNLRTMLLLMVVCFEMEMFINVGEWSSGYLYLRRKLDFTMVQYTR